MPHTAIHSVQPRRGSYLPQATTTTQTWCSCNIGSSCYRWFPELTWSIASSGHCFTHIASPSITAHIVLQGSMYAGCEVRINVNPCTRRRPFNSVVCQFILAGLFLQLGAFPSSSSSRKALLISWGTFVHFATLWNPLVKCCVIWVIPPNDAIWGMYLKSTINYVLVE